MRGLQCFFYEFWDLETHPLSDLTSDASTVDALMGGWCILMPESTRICHLRAYALYHMSRPSHGFTPYSPSFLRNPLLNYVVAHLCQTLQTYYELSGKP